MIDGQRSHELIKLNPRADPVSDHGAVIWLSSDSGARRQASECRFNLFRGKEDQ